MPDPRPTILIYTADLFFGLRIQDVVEKLGGRALAVSSAAELAAGLADVPALTIIELGADQGWVAAVHEARKRTRGAPIAAFGSHVDTAALAAARQAGCDYVRTKGRFMEELPALVERHLRPAADLPGCAETPNELVREGLRLFNLGQYYPCHDALEKAWVAEDRPCRALYQGILQLAIALHHIEGGNYDGADKMLRRATAKFQRLPATCQGIDAAGLLQTCRRLQQTLLELGPAALAAFPRHTFPTIPIPG
ncbi:MAG: DUF309 domain-containing protein [Caldilineales bacterium]|nr:DUF309 domain-containing protein [Caldilineales bacterium]MCW5859423.1 DUF309 domain-containing protein [Caldilineales bacterium]